jgi:transcriptional regulator with GAF, ATPase, and Fis domain
MDLTTHTVAPPTLNVRSRAPCEFASVKVATLIEGTRYISGMLVHSAEFKEVLSKIARFAPHKTTVLIQGESGTGKELVARALHNSGAVASGPFVTFNCSNLMDSLAESQLFGHVKGAFTDAREDSPGYFRSANGGTLFLDEIGELPLRLQPKLLRAVEAHEIQPVGSAQTYKVNIKLICASNRDLLAMVKDGSFRADLYYRLNAAAILVPPLRDREGAIPAFVGHFIAHYNRAFGKDIRSISHAALEAIGAHSWPGNIRELGHAIESAVLLADGNEIELCHLPIFSNDGSVQRERAFRAIPTAILESAPSLHEEAPKDFSLEMAIGDASKEILLRALKATDGHCEHTARLLGISRYTVYRMIARHRLGSLRDYHRWSQNSRTN